MTLKQWTYLKVKQRRAWSLLGWVTTLGRVCLHSDKRSSAHARIFAGRICAILAITANLDQIRSLFWYELTDKSPLCTQIEVSRRTVAYLDY